jgi:hypothetical protein
MSKQALRKVIEQHNFFAKWAEKPEININDLYKITDENITTANELYDSIEGHLSPENLHCDGEISRTEAMKKYRMYMGAVDQLVKMGYRIPDDCYECKG